MQTTSERDFYTIPELARASSVTPAAIYGWLARGLLKGYRMGAQRRVSKVEWQRFLNRGNDEI
jgi:excisionase family DNA binding protein